MRQLSFLFGCFLLLMICCGCQQDQNQNRNQQLSELQFSQVRLADGVALNLRISVYWQAIRPAADTETGPMRPDSVLLQLLQARGTETVREVSNNFTDVDSVFSTQREEYILAIKEELLAVLPEPDLTIHEVIVLDVQFPQSFTQALEEIGLQELRETQIHKQKELALTQAAANEEKAKANGKVAIAQAEAEGRLQAIQARTENDRRKIELARAETAAVVARTQASAEVDRLRKIKVVEVEKQREIEMIEVEKQREMDKVSFEQQIALAELCEKNPVYASFLVNRELAGNVEIAVLPSGTGANVFGGLLQSRLPGKSNAVAPSGN